ncbi:MAG: cupin domain-containing protein [Chloroflexi bacterium]|nr:cupin domain-containing protein [Chloroflexota bacterium]
MPGKVRRIVTAINASGRSYIWSDTQLPTGEIAAGQPMRAGLWLTDSAPASNAGLADPVPDGDIPRIAPQHRGGTVFRITDFVPESISRRDPRDLAERGARVTADRSEKNPGFHATDTVDYAICLEGEIWAVMDEDETLMQPGDVLIQRGTYHAWSNRSDSVCRMAFILIDAQPIESR